MYLRMYQVLLAAGDSKSAKAMVSEIPNDDDRDVKCIIKQSCQVLTPKPKKKKKKSKKKRLSPPSKVG